MKKMESLKPNKIQVGVGLRHTHFPYLEEAPELQIDFFEGISENFMSTRGRPFNMLMKIRERKPVALHGVSLSIAGPEAPSQKYLQSLRELYEIVDPFITSDHLCWTGGNAHNLHNLLPFAYTRETLDFVTHRINFVQDYLGRELTLENVSAYFSLKSSTMSEPEFLNELCQRTGSKILFDLNNIYVNSVNQKFNAREYIRSTNPKYISQIHLAGFSDMGSYLFDTHSREVSEEVWNLLRFVRDLEVNVPTLVEWDENIPEFTRVEEEALKARKVLMEEK